MRNRAAFIGSIFSIVFTAGVFAAVFGSTVTVSEPAEAGWVCPSGNGECNTQGRAPTIQGACEAYIARIPALRMEKITRVGPSIYRCDFNPFNIWINTWVVCDPLREDIDIALLEGCQPKTPEEDIGCTSCASAPKPRDGDPITLQNGNSHQAVTDYRSSGADVLEFTRYYNSLTPRVSRFGPKWQHTYWRGVGLRDSDTAIVLRPDGQALTFKWNGVAWAPESDITGRLVQTAAGYTYTDENDTVETYGTSRGLVSIVKKNGYTQTIGRDAANRIATVTDSHGRTLSFTYTTASSGHLATMTDPQGRVYRYTYRGITDYTLFSSQITDQVLKSVVYPDDTPANSADNPTVTYLYRSSTAMLTGIVDENGDRTNSWEYGAYNRATASELAGGADRVDIAYTNVRLGDPYNIFMVSRATVTDALGKITKYGFSLVDEPGNYVSIRTPGFQRFDNAADLTPDTLGYTYDTRGFVSSSTDWNGNLTRYAYNARGLQTSRTEAAGTAEERTITTVWDPGYRVPTRIVEPERTTEMTYDADGLLHRRTVIDTTTHSVPYSTNGQSRTWTYSYNAQSLVETVDGPRTDVADVTTYAYDPVTGDLVSVTNAAGHVTRITSYNTDGQPLTTLDANGVEMTLTYDDRQRMKTRTVDSGIGGTPAVTTFAYDFSGQMINMTLPNGSTLMFEYDAASRLIAIENILGERIEYSHDAMGNRTGQTVKSVDGAIVRTSGAMFDSLGRLLKSIGAYAGEEMARGYDENGNIVSVTDPLGYVTSHAFDALNRLIQVTDPAIDGVSGVVSYTYDFAGNMEIATDQRGLSTSYVHNGFGDAVQQSSPDTGATVSTRDAAGNKVSRTDARGVVTQWTYDALGRVTTMTFPASPAENVAWTYDDVTPGYHGIGRLARVVDDSGSTSYRYDARGNIVRDVRIIGMQPYVTQYAYDTSDLLISMTYPSGRIVDYARDSIGRVTNVTTRENELAVVVALASSGTYQAFGPLVGLAYGNGVATSRGYDLDGRMASIDTFVGLTPILDLDYGFDVAGSITGITDAGGGPRGQTFQYDPLYRLTLASGNYGASDSRPGPPSFVALPPRAREALSRRPARIGRPSDGSPTAGTIAYSYDSVGNRTARLTEFDTTTTTETYAYDDFSNRLLSVASDARRSQARDISYDDNGNTVADKKDGRDLAFAYDATARLAGVTDGGVPLVRYVHNAHGQRVVKEVDDQTTHYVYDLGGRLIAEYNSMAATWIEYVWLEGMPLAYFTGGRTHYVHTDHLGTPQLLTDEAGNTVWSAVYRPFGETAHAGGAVAFNLRFPGQYFDAETGYHYNYFRTYDPSTGRYLESDPIGLRGGWNTYAYAAGLPTIFTDRLGLRPDGVRCRADKPVWIDSWIVKSTEWPTGRTESRFAFYEYDNQSVNWGLGWLPPPDRVGYGLFIYSAKFKVYRTWEEMEKNDLYQMHKYTHVRCLRNERDECGNLRTTENIHVNIQEAGTKYFTQGTYWKPTDKTFPEPDGLYLMYIAISLW